ncbi:hypothetical protein [Granulicella arctica]|uniref:Uncharacterized protein n=1 Tax=Granulicella arctica TaxID=940613 RepID=A0A7Y9PJ31_9BACT|nr:hypothetical protein [Granulicella arctica]NYF80840.1 hypothetical protein [Granulicella arctica]
MEMQLIIADNETGATTTLLRNGLEWSKEYTSWQQALDDALSLNLLTSDLHHEAESLPPAFPYYGLTQAKSRQLAAAGFTHHHALAA